MMKYSNIVMIILGVLYVAMVMDCFYHILKSKHTKDGKSPDLISFSFVVMIATIIIFGLFPRTMSKTISSSNMNNYHYYRQLNYNHHHDLEP